MKAEPLYISIIGIARALWFLEGLKFTVRGEENIPATGGAVIAINHTGYMDFTYLGLPVRKHKRLVRFMAKREVFDNKISGPLMRGMKHISVDRADGNRSYLEAVSELKRGELIGVFPEATISRSFELKEFKSGMVRMALEAGVPIIPVTIWGSQRVWTKDHPKQIFKRLNTPIHITVGEPITATEPIDECVEEVRGRMTELLHRTQDEYAAAHGPYPRGAWWVPARLGGSAPTPEQARELDRLEMEERRRKREEKQRDE